MSTTSFVEEKEQNLVVSKFLDFDKDEIIFYNNLYIDEFKLVVKIPLSSPKSEISRENIKIEKFDLARYTYLTKI